MSIGYEDPIGLPSAVSFPYNPRQYIEAKGEHYGPI